MKHTHHLPLLHPLVGPPPRLTPSRLLSPSHFTLSLSLFRCLVSVFRENETERESTLPLPPFSPQERGYNPLTHRAQSKIQAAQAAHSTVDVPSITHRHERRRERRDKKRIREMRSGEGRKEEHGRHLRGTIGEVPTRDRRAGKPRPHYNAGRASTPARPRNLLSGCQFEPNFETSIASTPIFGPSTPLPRSLLHPPGRS